VCAAHDEEIRRLASPELRLASPQSTFPPLALPDLWFPTAGPTISLVGPRSDEVNRQRGYRPTLREARTVEPSVYIETSIISYLAARPSRDLVTAAHQQLTSDWWSSRRAAFGLYISVLVVQEAGEGDAEAAQRRLSLLAGIPVIAASAEALEFAKALVSNRIVPPAADTDALHIAIAATSGMEYLLTWNCRHIANAQIRARVEAFARQRGIEPPILCTPEELMEIAE